MKKIAIITLNGYFNFGNRLQNYALQEMMQSFGFSVDTVIFNRLSKWQYIYTTFASIKNIVFHPYRSSIRNKRISLFKEFSKHNLSETNKVYTLRDDLSELNRMYDYFVVGSDQVWNPNINKISSFYFLDFSDESKRISYAPSFGINEIPKAAIPYYEKWINAIPHLSSREQRGVEIIKELTGRDASLLLDPTLLLDKKSWLNISKAPKDRVESPFLLTYFLGDVPQTTIDQIQEIAQLRNLDIINLGDQSDRAYCEVGPSEFIDYMSNCSFFCTDSFHGTVFSVLFEKPFVVYEREGCESMYSRIETLLFLLDLTHRQSSEIHINQDVFNVDYSIAKSNLEKERLKSIQYLKNALGIID